MTENSTPTSNSRSYSGETHHALTATAQQCCSPAADNEPSCQPYRKPTKTLISKTSRPQDSKPPSYPNSSMTERQKRCGSSKSEKKFMSKTREPCGGPTELQLWNYGGTGVPTSSGSITEGCLRGTGNSYGLSTAATTTKAIETQIPKVIVTLHLHATETQIPKVIVTLNPKATETLLLILLLFSLPPFYGGVFASTANGQGCILSEKIHR